jgi:methyl-accepting chemotaxis protein
MEAGSSRVQGGVARADQAGAALQTILDAVESTASQVAEIAQATRGVVDGAQRVAETMGRLSVAVDKSATATAEMAAQTEQVSGRMQTISGLATDQAACTEAVTAGVQDAARQIQLLFNQAQDVAAELGLNEGTPQTTLVGPATFDLAA